MNRIIFSVCFVAVLGLSSLTAAAPSSLLPNGDFENGTTGWPTPAGVTLEQEKKNHFLRLHPTAAGQTINVFRQMDLGGVKDIQLSYRVRTVEIKRGSEAWHDARIILEFKDAAGAVVKPGPSHPFFTGSTDGWKDKTLRIAVPPGAVTFSVMPAMFQAESGTFDIDDIQVVAVEPDKPATK